jgi:CHAD domain-containing protein
MDSSPPAGLARWLAAERPRRLRAFAAGATSPRVVGLFGALPYLRDVPPDVAEKSLDRIARRVRRRGAAFEEQTTVDSLHRLRRSLRRLRYAREWLERGEKEIPRVLDALGAVGDLVVALRLVDVCPSRNRLAAYRREVGARIAAATEHAAETWKVHGGRWRR